MIEIFTDIPNEIKDGAELIFDSALSAHNPAKMVKILNDYVNLFPEEEYREFINFYFNMRMRQILDDNNNNQR